MATFTDNEQRVWELKITAAHLRPAQELGIDIHKLTANGLQPLARLVADPRKLVSLAWILVENQALAQSVEPDQFGLGCRGQIEALANALVEAVAGWHVSTRPAVLTAWKKAKEAGDILETRRQGAAESAA